MNKITNFSFKPQPGPYETWSLCSELIKDDKRTGKTVPGFVIDFMGLSVRRITRIYIVV